MTRTLVILSIFAASAGADVLHVPGDYLTIQAAIDASVDGDTVLVADGIYTGDGNRDMNFGGRAITVEGNVADPSLCVIDIDASEGDPHRAFWFHTGEGDDSIIRGFTIRNGFMDRGGAVACENGASPLFEDCVFTLNKVVTDSESDGGGAIHVGLSCGATINDCDFLENEAEVVVSGMVGGGAIRSMDFSTVTIVGCHFEGNTQSGRAMGVGRGGAVFDRGAPSH